MAQQQQHVEDLEYKLYDVLDQIFRHLPVKSLRNVAQVSRSWNDAAKREMSKRGPGPLCRVLLPVLYDQDLPEFNADDYFISKPNTILMFCGPRPNMRPILSLEYKIMAEYHEKLPNRIIILGVDQAMMDTKEVRSCKMQTFCSIDAPPMCNNILGLCLPESDDLTIKIAECVSHEKDVRQKAEKIFNELQPRHDVRNPIFLLFSRNDYTVGSQVLKMFREKYSNKALNLWGSTISDFIKRSDDGYPEYRGTHGFLGILVHAPRLRAHCLVLPIDDDEQTMAKKLADFHASFKLRRRSVGLVCGPRKSERPRWFQQLERDDDDAAAAASKKNHNPEDLMRIVKREFTSVDFTGIFNEPEFYYYGCDHTHKDGDYSLEHKMVLSIMILTYD